VLRDGGNAVDAALAAIGVAFVAEPMLTALGAGGYMLVVTPQGERTLLDFSVEACGRGTDPAARADLLRIDVSFGDAVQPFFIGASSVAAYGMPAGMWEAARRFGSRPLADLVAPGARLARTGVVINPSQGYMFEILGGIVTASPESAAVCAPGGRLLHAGDRYRWPDLADALERLGREGPRPFYHGDVARAVASFLRERGGLLTLEDLAAYRVINRVPVRAAYRGREVVTNPPPSAGGTLIAYALARLAEAKPPPGPADLVAAMHAAQVQRTPAFLAALGEGRSPLGSTTHISVLDGEGRACSVTSSNGAGSGVVVPGTGLHLNNMLGETDLNPEGFHRHSPGRRLPSMMAPTVVLAAGGATELVLGSGGSNRIRSAIAQTIVNAVDRGLDVDAAVQAPRVHFEGDTVFAEPGVDLAPLREQGRVVVEFRDRNLFFGGVNAVQAHPPSGAGDPRRGGAARVV